MELTEINKLLKNLNELRYSKRKKTIENDGETTYEIYELDDDLGIRLKVEEDSYGSESITGIEFVKQTTKTITTYEPLNN